MLEGADMSVARAAPILVARVRFLMGFLVAAEAPPNVMPLPTGADNDGETVEREGDDGVGPRPVLDFSGSDAADFDMKLNDDDGAVICGSGGGGTGVCKKPKPLDAVDSAAAAACGAGAGVAPPPPMNENPEVCSDGAFSASPFPMNENPEGGAGASVAGAGADRNEKPDEGGLSSLPSFDDVPFTSNPPNMDSGKITTLNDTLFTAIMQHSLVNANPTSTKAMRECV